MIKSRLQWVITFNILSMLLPSLYNLKSEVGSDIILDIEELTIEDTELLKSFNVVIKSNSIVLEYDTEQLVKLLALAYSEALEGADRAKIDLVEAKGEELSESMEDEILAALDKDQTYEELLESIGEMLRPDENQIIEARKIKDQYLNDYVM